MILAGDVGGTKIHLAICESAARQRRVHETVIATAAVESLAEAAARFVSGCGTTVQAAAFGVAGPVVDERVVGTNLPWPVDAAQLSHEMGGIPVRLLNDLEAAGHAMAGLTADEVAVLQVGVERAGVRALVSPGTGLGESLLIPSGGDWISLAGEGGHADFAPRTQEEWELHRYLAEHFGRVSYERIVSGPGLVNVYCWLRDSGRCPDDLGVAAVPGENTPAVAIGTAAAGGNSGIGREAARIWTTVLGAEAGNTVLRGVALGGLYLGGGIPARLLPRLREPWFLDAFLDKHPHRELLEGVPVRVVLVEDTTVRGAARAAAAEL